MRVYVARVSFVYAVRVFGVLLRLCCVCFVFSVLYCLVLGFGSMDLYSYSVWTPFLQPVVFVCELVAMPFWRRSCVFFSISLLFLLLFIVYNVMEVAVVLDSRVLLFTLILS